MKEKGIKITIICVLVLSSILAIIGFAYNKTRLLVENNFSIKGNDKISVLYGQNYDDEGYYFLSNDKNDYSKSYDLDYIKDFLYKKGISTNYNEKMTRQQINKLNEDLNKIEGINNVQLVTKEDAINVLKQLFQRLRVFFFAAPNDKQGVFSFQFSHDFSKVLNSFGRQ